MTKKIALPVNETGILDAHFGHCKFFALVNTDGDKVISEEKVVPPPHEPGLLPQWLGGKGVTDIIAGGMGQKAIQLFNQNGVNAFVGAPQLNAIELVKGHLDGTLNFTANYCNHDADHECGGH
ncbi:NifB/NifX family molybdenum-iron cluster-binding protein [Carboxylicivirga caseinilyticus]|uniref:NifB/NifX family molybdenum-iron cluster-binding protein n=1 Tax=Carboxylicivirga caseinilyticus TaxID=3417572 RepID=UPI003D32C727|nr:ATPase [Marinilabiliaceae bacterium A049]